MAEYINRDEFIISQCHSCDGACENLDCDCLNCKETCRCSMIQDLMEFPAADVVAVIRCRDCRFFAPDVYGDDWCSAKIPGVSKGMFSPSGDSYCSDAEIWEES